MALAQVDQCVLIVVDMQPKFLAPIFEASRVHSRTLFLIRAAKLLGVPICATEQNPERMFGTDPVLAAELSRDLIWPKMEFSALGCPQLEPFLNKQDRGQLVVCGIETHICINQTAHHLLERGYEVLLASDAVSARTQEMHDVGLRGMISEGATLTHTESLVYEWLGSANHPAFRSVLELVKNA